MKLNSEIDVLGANADFFFKGKLLYKTKMATSSKLISNQILKKKSIHPSNCNNAKKIFLKEWRL